MKQPSLGLVMIGLSLTGSALMVIPAPAAAQKNVRFFCGRDARGVPSTMVETTNAARPAAPLIRWTSQYFSGSGFSPAYRCAVVSKKFQTAYTQNPNFVFTTTVANSEPVICAADSRGGACKTLLYTVKRGVQDPILTMLRLEQVRAGASGPLNESTGGGSSEPGYVGVQEVLATVFSSSPEAMAPTATPATSQPNATPVSPAAAPAVTPKSLW